MTLLTPPPPAATPTPQDTTPANTYTPVMGDGTTARSRLRARWRAARFPLAAIGLVILVGIILALSEDPTSQDSYAPNNPQGTGAMALAQVLEHQGVDITYVRTTAEAAAHAEAGTTLVLFNDWILSPDQASAIAGTQADLVLVEPGDEILEKATGGKVTTGYGGYSEATRTARCTDPDAQAAGDVRWVTYTLKTSDPQAVSCFNSADGSGYVVLNHDGRTVRSFADDEAFLNESITEDGNAALALRALGHHASLTWFVPDYADDTLPGQPGSPEGDGLMPPWASIAFLQCLVILIVVMWWRGRRLGPLFTEDLPVVVRASETTRGRGRLYRKARSRGHAAASLRAASADRMAMRLGLPRSAPAQVLVDAIARATGTPTDQVAELLYGPPPTDDAALVALARELDHLESEVYHT